MKCEEVVRWEYGGEGFYDFISTVTLKKRSFRLPTKSYFTSMIHHQFPATHDLSKLINSTIQSSYSIIKRPLKFIIISVPVIPRPFHQ